MKKSIDTRKVDQVSVGNLITQLFIWNFEISLFQAVAVGYTKSYHSERSLKAANNTPSTGILRLSTWQNYQMICRPYYWDKQHVNISSLILMAAWLMAMYRFQKMTFHFLSVFNGPTSILSARNHFCGIFLSSHKYFQDIFLRRVRDITE